MAETLRTRRLKLRPPVSADVPAITEAMQRVEVARMLTRPPWPYSRDDAEAFVARAGAEPNCFGVEHDGQFVGVVTAQAHLGYWFAPRAWGHGFATEASAALVNLRFTQSSSILYSGHREGNVASRRVLQKLGFMDAEIEETFFPADGITAPLQRMVLTRERWEAGNVAA